MVWMISKILNIKPEQEIPDEYSALPWLDFKITIWRQNNRRTTICQICKCMIVQNPTVSTHISDDWSNKPIQSSGQAYHNMPLWINNSEMKLKHDVIYSESQSFNIKHMELATNTTKINTGDDNHENCWIAISLTATQKNHCTCSSLSMISNLACIDEPYPALLKNTNNLIKINSAVNVRCCNGNHSTCCGSNGQYTQHPYTSNYAHHWQSQSPSTSLIGTYDCIIKQCYQHHMSNR